MVPSTNARSSSAQTSTDYDVVEAAEESGLRDNVDRDDVSARSSMERSQSFPTDHSTRPVSGRPVMTSSLSVPSIASGATRRSPGSERPPSTAATDPGANQLLVKADVHAVCESDDSQSSTDAADESAAVVDSKRAVEAANIAGGEEQAKTAAVAEASATGDVALGAEASGFGDAERSIPTVNKDDAKPTNESHPASPNSPESRTGEAVPRDVKAAEPAPSDSKKLPSNDCSHSGSPIQQGQPRPSVDDVTAEFENGSWRVDNDAQLDHSLHRLCAGE